MRIRTRNGWLDWAVRIVGLLLVGAALFLGYTVIEGERQTRAGSLTGRAVSNLEEMVRQNPEDVTARLLLADAYRDVGQLNDAVEQYTQALELDKDSVQALSGLGSVAMLREEWRTAEGYWLRVIDLLAGAKDGAQAERLERAYYLYGTTLIQLAEYEEAVGFLKEAVRIRKDNADTRYALAVAYGKLDLKDNQRQELEVALAFVPSMPEANYDLGLIMLEAGDRAQAAELFRRSVDAAPGRPEPMDALLALGPFEERIAASDSLAESDPETALIEARIAYALDTTSADAARRVARLLQRLGNEADARSSWQQVLKLAPGDTEATAALAELK